MNKGSLIKSNKDIPVFIVKRDIGRSTQTTLYINLIRSFGKLSEDPSEENQRIFSHFR